MKIPINKFDSSLCSELKVAALIVICLAFFLNFSQTVRAVGCEDTSKCTNSGLSDDQKSACLGDVENQCQQLLDEAKGQEQTLQSQLSYIDTQTKLAQAKIADANFQIGKLNSEISDLSGRITKLSSTLDSMTEVLLNRIVETYKYGNVTPIDLLFSSHGFSDMLANLQYIEVAQANDKKVLYQLQATKAVYNDQKTDKVTRQAQEEKLQQELKTYQTQLTEQKQAKDQLLSVTQNNEATYQKLLAQAQAQLAAFQGFVQSQGGLTLITADPGWPSGYYSQRDVRWGSMAIGNGSYSIGLAGCLVSSVAMVLTHKGNTQTPATVGSNSSYFFDGDFQWSALTSLGFNSPLRTTSTSTLDSALSAGKWAIAGIGYSSNLGAQPFHFVVVTSKNGDDYNLFDPWKGPNVSFNSNYPGDSITEVITY